VPARRIVAIDFDAQIGDRLRAAFAPPEFDFHWFAEGRVALEALPELQPDAIICEVLLPDIDGRAVLEAVKRSPDLAGTPFLVLSGVRSQPTIRGTLDAGAAAYLLKPFPVSQLVQAIRKVLGDGTPDSSEVPAGAVLRPATYREGRMTVARPARESALVPAARAAVSETAGRQRIGFETRDPAPGAPRAEASALAPRSRDPLRSDDSIGAPPPEAEPAPTVAPVRLEGRISSLELSGARVRVLTEAEAKGQGVVVRTTVTRDGKELRRVDTTWDRSLQSEEDESAFKELIGAQHASALEDVRRLLTPATIAPQAPAPEVQPPLLFEPPPEASPARGPDEGVRPTGTERRKRQRARRPPAPAADTVVLNREGEASEPPALAEQPLLPMPEVPSPELNASEFDAPELNAPDLSLDLPAPGPGTGRRTALAVAVGALIALGLLIGRPLLTARQAQPEAKATVAPAPPASSAVPSTPETSGPPTGPHTSPQQGQAPPRAAQAAPEGGQRPAPGIAERRTPAGGERRGSSLGRMARGRLDWAQALFEAERYGEASAAVNEVFKLAPANPEARQLATNIQAVLAARAAAEPPRSESPAGAPPERPAPAAQAEGEPPASAPAERPAPAPHAEGESPGSPSRQYPGWLRVNPPPRNGRALGEQASPQPPEEPARESVPKEPEAPAPQETKSAAAPEEPPAVVRGALVKLGEPGVAAPVAQSRPELRYPRVAQLQKAEGIVELRALVDETGRVADTLVVGGPTGKLGFREAAVDYVKAWRYAPARKDGVPVKVWVPVRIDFRLPR
jgi:protein TonB